MGNFGATFGSKLKEFREAKGLTQEELGDELGVSRATINRWEGHGAGTATLDMVESAQKLFQRSAAELLGISSTQISPHQALAVLAEAIGEKVPGIPKLKVAEDPLIAEIRGYTEEQREHLKEAMESIRGMAKPAESREKPEDT